LDLKIEGSYSGGTFEAESDAAATTLIVTITNSGTMPSIARDWHFFAELEGVQHESLLMPLTGIQTITMQAPALPGVRPERTVTYTAADSIFTKAAIPISPGAMVQGILPALFKGVSPEKFRSGPKYTLVCRDVLGQESSHTVETNSPCDIGYYPLINQTFK
jgi:hypothetical protein